MQHTLRANHNSCPLMNIRIDSNLTFQISVITKPMIGYHVKIWFTLNEVDIFITIELYLQNMCNLDICLIIKRIEL